MTLLGERTFNSHEEFREALGTFEKVWRLCAFVIIDTLNFQFLFAKCRLSKKNMIHTTSPTCGKVFRIWNGREAHMYCTHVKTLRMSERVNMVNLSLNVKNFHNYSL